jgi:membrane protein DedA with SNARE-associated domain
MPLVSQFIEAWGYVAISVIVILGNLGIPIPEETALTVGGYLAWQGHLKFLPVVLVGLVSAVVGDNIGYLLGRRYGRLALAHWGRLSPERLARMQRFVLGYGMLAVFIARFVAGLRFMAGPLAGSSGMGFLRFFVANVLGAMVYVPVIVGAGYAVGYGLGDRIDWLRRMAGDAEHLVWLAVILVAAAIWLVLRRRRPAAARPGKLTK